MPADKTKNAVHHHDLAMVAKVDLKAIEPAAASGEGLDLDTTIAQCLYVFAGQGVAADAVV
ncbi:hypothetical protein D3C78_1974120 [compost metagenome]